MLQTARRMPNYIFTGIDMDRPQAERSSRPKDERPRWLEILQEDLVENTDRYIPRYGYLNDHYHMYVSPFPPCQSIDQSVHASTYLTTLLFAILPARPQVAIQTTESDATGSLGRSLPYLTQNFANKRSHKRSKNSQIVTHDMIPPAFLPAGHPAGSAPTMTASYYARSRFLFP